MIRVLPSENRQMRAGQGKTGPLSTSAASDYRVVIPARYGASRLPGKPLIDLAGKPLIQWVYERACYARAIEVIIATDDERIASVARGFGADVAMTATTHLSGTDRIAEVTRNRGWPDDAVVVNVQGDEPLLPAALITQVAELLALHADADIATLAAPVSTVKAMLDPNTVKVVCDQEQRALYFSRAPIPWQRDSAPTGLASQGSHAGARRHIGLYAYRVASLQRLTVLPPTPLEQAEKLEQLRALEHGFKIRVAEACEQPGPDVNTADDLQRVLALLLARPA
jgi:3-deoxy-manno-octulosonate cytidylyltransferase (CMP-KDO synthetase)